MNKALILMLLFVSTNKLSSCQTLEKIDEMEYQSFFNGTELDSIANNERFRADECYYFGNKVYLHGMEVQNNEIQDADKYYFIDRSPFQDVNYIYKFYSVYGHQNISLSEALVSDGLFVSYLFKMLKEGYLFGRNTIVECSSTLCYEYGPNGELKIYDKNLTLLESISICQEPVLIALGIAIYDDRFLFALSQNVDGGSSGLNEKDKTTEKLYVVDLKSYAIITTIEMDEFMTGLAVINDYLFVRVKKGNMNKYFKYVVR